MVKILWEKVLVVGGGMVGCEVAAFLGEQEHEVTVIELREEVGADVISEHRKFLMNDFENYNIHTITGAKVSKFYDNGVDYLLTDGTEHDLKGFDSVVLAMGSRNYDPLSEVIKEVVKETYIVGDAVKARRALDATKKLLK